MITVLQLNSRYRELMSHNEAHTLVLQLIEMGAYKTVAYVDNDDLDATLKLATKDNGWINRPTVICKATAQFSRAVREGDLLVKDQTAHFVRTSQIQRVNQ